MRIDRYFADNPDDVRPNTLVTYRRYADSRVRPRLGARRIHALTTPDFAQLRRALVDSGLSPSSVNQILAVCRSACRYAVEGLGWMASNPQKSNGRRWGNAKSKPRPRPTTTRWSSSWPATTGCGRSSKSPPTPGPDGPNCAGSDGGDFQDGTLTIQRSVDERRNVSPTKTHAARTIPLQPGCVDVLASWHDQQLAELAELEGVDWRGLEDDWYVWPDLDDPARPSYPGHWTKAVKAASGGTVKLHGHRHLAATLMIGAGVDPRAAANRLGHSSPTMTADTYAASTSARDVVAGESIGNALGR